MYPMINTCADKFVTCLREAATAQIAIKEYVK